MRVRFSSRGFTLPELLVVIGVLAFGAIAAVFLLRPASYDTELLLAERRTEVAHLSQLLSNYHRENGSWPDGITTSPKVLGNSDGQLDLCKTLVPRYAEDLPVDPLIGYKIDKIDQEYTGASCASEGITYDTALAVSVSKDGQHSTVSAQKVERFSDIKITR